MSRIGKHPVAIPAGVAVSLDEAQITVNGKLGSLRLALTDKVAVTREGEAVRVQPRDESRQARMMWATTRTCIANLVKGVSEGFSRRLEIQGVGYRAQAQGRTVVLQLGYSHDIKYALPEGITVECPDQTHLVVKGADRQLVGQVASEIKSFRPVEPYKGKGIRYAGQHVLRKEGKKK
jgi:large subunit ribosomal protein L6